jgi:hypothetical protein
LSGWLVALGIALLAMSQPRPNPATTTELTLLTTTPGPLRGLGRRARHHLPS